MIKEAGRFNVNIWEDGSPIWIHLNVKNQAPDDIHISMTIEQLHDLKYVIDSAMRIVNNKHDR